MLGERELCVLPSGERVVWEVSLEWALGEDTRGYVLKQSYTGVDISEGNQTLITC